MAEIATETSIEMILVAVVIIILLSMLVLSVSIRGEHRVRAEEQKKELVERLQRAVQLLDEPDVHVICTGVSADGRYNYQVELKGAIATFAGSSGETLSVIPVLEFRDVRYRDASGAEITLESGKHKEIGFSGPKLVFADIVADVPPPLDASSRDSYSGVLLPKQSVVVNNYSFTLAALRKSLFVAGDCEAIIWTQCDTGIDSKRLKLDDAPSCDGRTECSATGTLCGNPFTIVLSHYTAPDASCSDRKPFFEIKAPSRDGDWDFGQSVVLSFWHAPDERTEDCWRSSLDLMSSSCLDAFLGAYQISVPLGRIEGGKCVQGA